MGEHAEGRPIIVIACRVFENSLRGVLNGMPCTYMDSGLHSTPKKLTQALQATLDALPQPSVVLLGYGLCGNGLHGLRSGPHTLVIPRADDCISIFLGSQAERRRQLEADAGTYYLTPGWLETGSNPLNDHVRFTESYGDEQAAWLLQTMYGHYNKLIFIVSSPDDISTYGARAHAVARFVAERFGWSYEEQLGTDSYLEQLVAHSGIVGDGSEFVVVRPGGQLHQSMFLDLPGLAP